MNYNTLSNTSQIPALEELQSRPQWVCYCLEHAENDAERLTKVPYNARNGYKASSTNPKQWSNSQQAKSALENAKNVDGKPYAGIGYVFNRDVTGIDLDHCIDANGNIDEWAQEIIDSLASYGEVSPSGEGIHLLVHGLVPLNQKGKHAGRKTMLPGKRHPKAAVEMYSEGRFFTITEKHLPGTPDTIEDRQEQLLAVHAQVYAPKQKQDKAGPTGPTDLGDNELLDKAMKTSKFAALWRGDASDYQGDESRADAAMCAYLAFWTGKDKHRMDALFRRSGLYREKWDRETSSSTYGWLTIEHAIDQCSEVYTPGGRRAAAEDVADVSSDGKPKVYLNGQLREQIKSCLQVLRNANQPDPHIFMYLGLPSTVTKDEHGSPMIMQLGITGIRNELTWAANFFTWKRKGEFLEEVEAHPTRDLADQMLGLAPCDWKMPALKTMVQAPVLRPDGTILDKPGYDEATRLYYVPSDGMERCNIPTNPTQADAQEAMDFLRPIFADFPFESDADRANAFGLLFTPFVRHAVKKDIQMALIDATNAGTGKGKIANVVSIAATGKTFVPMTAKKDDDEWRKSILTELLKAPRIIVIDNVRGVLESQALEAVLTSEAGISERILGQSKSASPRNEATWMVTGNNLLIGGDLPRRCYRIRMISPTATPEERTDFQIPGDLEDWMHENRAKVVTAILTIARAWYVAGKPKGENPVTLGTFSDWARTIGGMLEFSGIKGWQTNRDVLRSRNNEEAQDWEAFLLAWYNEFKDAWKGASDVADEIMGKNKPSATDELNPLAEALPTYLKSMLAEKPKSFHVVLPIQLGKRVQTVYGKDGFRIEKDKNEHTKGKLWRVVRMVADGSSPHSTVEKTCDNDKSSQEYADSPQPHSGVNHPQPSASLFDDFRVNGSNGSTPSASTTDKTAGNGHFAEGLKTPYSLDFKEHHDVMTKLEQLLAYWGKHEVTGCVWRHDVNGKYTKGERLTPKEWRTRACKEIGACGDEQIVRAIVWDITKRYDDMLAEVQ